MRYFGSFNLFAVIKDILYFVEKIAWSFIYYFRGIYRLRISGMFYNGELAIDFPRGRDH